MNYLSFFIIWTLALYGSFEIIRTIINILLSRKDKSKYVIVMVKDGEDNIEGVLRSEILKNYCKKNSGINKILVIDLDSKDKTREIIKKMENTNEYIHLIEWANMNKKSNFKCE